MQVLAGLVVGFVDGGEVQEVGRGRPSRAMKSQEIKAEQDVRSSYLRGMLYCLVLS